MLKKVLVLLVFAFLMMPMFVFGQYCDSDGSQPNLPPCSQIGVIQSGNSAGISGGITLANLIKVIMSGVNWLSWFVAVAAVVMGLYSGFLFITARDDANQLKTARQTMLYAIIGIGAAILSFSLILISKALLGIQ